MSQNTATKSIHTTFLPCANIVTKQGQIQSLSTVTFGNNKSKKLQFTIIKYTPNNNSPLRTFSNQTRFHY